jgi:hypothetical protein
MQTDKDYSNNAFPTTQQTSKPDLPSLTKTFSVTETIDSTDRGTSQVCDGDIDEDVLSHYSLSTLFS